MPVTSNSGPGLTQSIAFISNMSGSAWGGSEELWARTATRLVNEGWPVRASVLCAGKPHPRIRELERSGISLQIRKPTAPVWKRALNKMVRSGHSVATTEIAGFLRTARPALVVISDPVAWPPLGILEACIESNLPFATLSQANGEQFWPDEFYARFYREFMPKARRCYFVSNANRLLFERQIGCKLPNSAVVLNPFNLGEGSTVPASLPRAAPGDKLRFASVARLHPPSKGQDILLDALSGPDWRDRDWHLTFYGDGPMKGSIEWMIAQLGLEQRVTFAGYESSVEKIWSQNHVLVMPSRYEGMPLAVVEAMLCSRPVVATDISDHSTLIEDGVTGFLADAATPKSLELALERLWYVRHELETLGAAASRKAKAVYNRDPVGLFASELKRLVAEGGVGSPADYRRAG
jgi:glycosyltransferase involved in cell wall biosynthesis